MMLEMVQESGCSATYDTSVPGFVFKVSSFSSPQAYHPLFPTPRSSIGVTPPHMYSFLILIIIIIIIPFLAS